MSRPEQTPTVVPSTRVRVAQVLAFVALVAAMLGALGPAERVRTGYSWPPETLPAGAPERLWYTPLLLTRHRPDAILATVPCTPPPALPAADAPVTVLATARSPERAGGLSVVRSGDRLEISVGERVLHRLGLVADGDEDCAYRLRMGGGRWLLEGGPQDRARGGTLEEMPVVFGFLSELDLRTGTPPSIDITTAVHAARTITRQAVSWTVAVIAIIVALLLVAFDRRPRPLQAIRKTAGSAWTSLHPADAVVGVTLLGWWVLAPAFFDDGWVIARQSMFSSSRGFSAYFNTFAVNGPLSYELDWAQHWLSQSTSALVVLRIPALVALAVTWVVCRWALSRILASSVGGGQVALWTLTSAFLVGALAWGMTLRTEPVTALLVIAVVAFVIRFLEREATAPIAALALLVPIALTTHPEGTATLAPLLAVAPSLLGWARRQPAVATTIAASTISLFAVLAFLGSDLEQRRADAETTATYGLTVAWRYELIRYTSLADFPWGTPLRRASVALMALAILAFLVRRRANGRSLLDFPATALAIALVLFVATPSKHPWHFGALIGLAAVAIAAETARLRDEAARSRGWQARPFLVLVVAVVTIAWTWAPRQPWNAIDLRTLEWTPSFETALPVATLAAALPLLLLAAVWLRDIARGGRERLPDAPWRIAVWTGPVLAVPLLAFTIAVLVADAVKTDGWTLARQNLGALRRDAGCGLADDLLVADPASARAASAAGVSELRVQPAWMPPTPVAGLPRFALGPTSDASAASPWFDLTEQGAGLFVAGAPGEGDLALEWGHRQGSEIESMGTEEISTDFALDVGEEILTWRLVAAGELPEPESGADSFRVVYRGDSRPGEAVAVTGPVTYEIDELGRRLESAAAPNLVIANVLPYFPCARLPRLGDGIVEVPRHVVVTRDAAWVLQERETSPFSGIHDLYQLKRLPIADTPNPPRDVLAVFAVDPRMAGAVQAPPVTRRVGS